MGKGLGTRLMYTMSKTKPSLITIHAHAYTSCKPEVGLKSKFKLYNLPLAIDSLTRTMTCAHLHIAYTSCKPEVAAFPKV